MMVHVSGLVFQNHESTNVLLLGSSRIGCFSKWNIYVVDGLYISQIILAYHALLLLNICIPVLVFISTHTMLVTTSPNILYFVAKDDIIPVTIMLVDMTLPLVVPSKSQVILVMLDQM